MDASPEAQWKGMRQTVALPSYQTFCLLGKVGSYAFACPFRNGGEGGGNILWIWKIKKGKLVQIVSNLNKERINDNTKLMAPVDTQKITHFFCALFKNHGVSCGIKEILTNGEGPICDSKPKPFNLGR